MSQYVCVYMYRNLYVYNRNVMFLYLSVAVFVNYFPHYVQVEFIVLNMLCMIHVPSKTHLLYVNFGLMYSHVKHCFPVCMFLSRLHNHCFICLMLLCMLF